MNEYEKYLTKKDLEKLYNKKGGYYNSYCWFEDLICNVCGKLMHGGDKEWFKMEQEYVGVNAEAVDFCSKCAKIPNRLKLVKVYV